MSNSTSSDLRDVTRNSLKVNNTKNVFHHRNIITMPAKLDS